MKLAWSNPDQTLYLTRRSRTLVWVLALCNGAVFAWLISSTVRDHAFDAQTVCFVLLLLLMSIGPVLVALGRPVGRFVYLVVSPLILSYSMWIVPGGMLLSTVGFLVGGIVVFALNVAGVIVIYNAGRRPRQRPVRRSRCPQCGHNLRKQPRYARQCLECGFRLHPAVGAAPPTEPVETTY